MLIIFLLTISTTCGDPFHNYIMPYMMSKGDSGEADTNFALMLMMAQNAHHGGTGNLVYFFQFKYKLFSFRRGATNERNVTTHHDVKKGFFII